MAFELEVTDTYCGEANYCWVKRGETKVETRRGVVRALKALAGWTGMACQVEDYGDMIRVKPYRLHQIGFATWKDNV